LSNHSTKYTSAPDFYDDQSRSFDNVGSSDHFKSDRSFDKNLSTPYFIFSSDQNVSSSHHFKSDRSTKTIRPLIYIVITWRYRILCSLYKRLFGNWAYSLPFIPPPVCGTIKDPELMRAITLKRRSDLYIPKNETARPHSQFPHTCICERFIYSQERIGPPICCSKIGRRSGEYTV
jgi:hypothetical protein